VDYELANLHFWGGMSDFLGAH